MSNIKGRNIIEAPEWEEYVNTLSARLMHLQQLGSDQTYLDKFNELINRVNLTKEYKVICFLDGLRDEIQYCLKLVSLRTYCR